MEMELELDPRVKPLPYKVKAMSRETPAAKGTNVIELDLRTHWSTGTNTKEWILLELDEPCLLSNVRIYNKSVLEWEITAGLRYKPDAFVKVRPRCEALKRDMSYPANYTPCRYIRLSCLRGNPIAVFYIQLIGVSVKGLEPELQPVINYLLPHIMLHKQDAHDMHLQLLQDMASRLLFFLPQLEVELSAFTDSSDSNIRFLAMLAGPFYPILQIITERDAVKGSIISPDSDNFRNNQPSTITVSSNFEAQPRRSRYQSMYIHPGSCSMAFRTDAVILLLRRAFKDKLLGIVCRTAARVLQKIIGPIIPLEQPTPDSALSSMSIETDTAEIPIYAHITDYSILFGEEFEVPNENWNFELVNVLDIASVEEGILHVLYACAVHPALCSKLAESNLEFGSALPLIQSLLPALRPPVNSLDRMDDSFGQWKHPSIEQALSQIAIMSSSSTYHPLLHACAGYLSSYCSSHVKAACVLIDLCVGSFSPWISIVTAKVDLAIELMEDLLGIIQVPHQSITPAHIALKYILLGLSGHMDDILIKYKEHKHKLLFLIEMLEPFLGPVFLSFSNSLPGVDCPLFSKKQENNCSYSLNVIRAALRRPTVLQSLESEWRRGSVASSVLLSILGPNLSLPSDIDNFKCSTAKFAEPRLFKGPSGSVFPNVFLSKLSNSNDVDGKIDGSDNAVRFDSLEESSFLFAPQELKNTVLMSFTSHCIRDNLETSCEQTNGENQCINMKTQILMEHFELDSDFFGHYLNLKADYLKLANLHDCEQRATEFQHLALDLCSQGDITADSYDAVIDAFILSAECYINPFFVTSFTPDCKLARDLNLMKSLMNQTNSIMELRKDFLKTSANLEVISHLERKRDKAVIEILLQAANINKEYLLRRSRSFPDDVEHKELDLNILLPLDAMIVDAVTLLRQNQALLFQFVIQQLQRERHLSNEVLLQALLFLLQSATELLCPPEAVVDIILLSTEKLCLVFTSLYNELKDETAQFDLEKLHGLHRRWLLLERLVMASSGSDNDVISRKITFECQYRSLVPFSSWINKISKFSDGSPLSPFLGWMAVSRYAKQYLKENLFFASDLSQLRLLLSIFADELALVDNTSQLKIDEPASLNQSDALAHLQVQRESAHSHALEQGDSFHVLYPSLQIFFPSMSRKFRTFGETILEAVALQLKCLPSSAIPEILCWFSDVCMHPYGETIKPRHLTYGRSFNCLKGRNARNAKTVVLYILESLVTEHMESMLPEMPRIAQILISLCKTSYCDMAFLDSILALLRPLISFFLKKETMDENLLSDASFPLDFESSSFKELFDSIKLKGELRIGSEVDRFQGFFMIFILGTLLPDFSLKRKIDILQSLLPWAGFTSSEPTSSFYNYLYAFEKIFESCEILLDLNLEHFGLIVPFERQVESYEIVSISDEADISSTFSGYRDLNVTTKPAKEVICTESVAGLRNLEIHHISNEEMKDFSEGLENLVLRLIPEIEKSWKLHYKLASKLTMKIARCYLLSSCLKFVDISDSTVIDNNGGTTPNPSSRDLPDFWKDGLQGFTRNILAIQESGYWRTASTMLDYLFRLPETVSLDHGIRNLCSAIKIFCLRAPMMSWRLQTDKWLTFLFQRGLGNFEVLEDLLVDLFSTMLSHPEPEQRAVALHHLGVMVGLDTRDAATMLSSVSRPNLGGILVCTPLPGSAISSLASNTWDRVAALILSDPSMILRSHAMALLSGYVPFITRPQLQSFLISASSILQGMGKLSPLMEEGQLARLSLGLLATACLYSPSEDIALIPESIWRNLEQMETSKTGWLDDVEKSCCSALSRLRIDLVGGKEALKEVLSHTSPTKLVDPNFKSIRESILQVLPSLTSTQAYFDFFSKKADQESQELEEAEIELGLLQKENVMRDTFGTSNKDHIIYDKKDVNRLQQIKNSIQSLELSKLKEEVAARIQKKLIMRRSRQEFLEEVISREMELLQELDRERKNELELEIERQRQLEYERARSRELQFNLDMERERQTQKELQRELEQLESGVRSYRREFSSNLSSQAREKYRERDIVRSGPDGGLVRPVSTSTPAMVLSGSRTFSGQSPTILQPRDRSVDRSVNNDDNLEGSRDSGDANNIGDPELSSAFDALPGFGSVPRRGGKSRQLLERREREGRREGKWERKHS